MSVTPSARPHPGNEPLSESPGGSWWLTSTADAPHRPPAPPGLEVDVAVVGGGIVGLTAALLLRRDGASVAVLEAGAIGAGVTGCSTAKVTALQDPVYARLRSRVGSEAASGYAAANVAGLERLRRFVEEDGIDCEWRVRDAVTYVSEAGDPATIEDEYEAARAAGLPVTLEHDVPELPFVVPRAVRLAGQGELHGRRYVLGLAERLEAEGGMVHERTRVTDVDSGSPCILHTGEGPVRAGQVVIATHYPILDRALLFARMSVARSYCVALQGAELAPAGMFYAAEQPSRSLRLTPAGDGGELLIVGGEGHKAGAGGAGAHARLEDWGRRHFGTAARVVARWSAQDATAADDLPFAGALPGGRGRIWTVTGLRKWGFASGTTGAEILAAAIAGRDHPQAALFRPSRFDVRAELPEDAVTNARVGLRFARDRLRGLTRASGKAPGPGEGAVLFRHGQRVAVHRDDDGVEHQVSAICPHLGCEVAFNAAERSWDCPCHGSRFDVDGGLLEGPATRGLEPARRDAPLG